MTTIEVVVDEACCLKVGVADSRAEEFEATVFHVSCYGV